MENIQGFDMKAYIEKRMLEITDLEERKLFKKTVGDILLSLYDYNKESYKKLEKQILEECSLSQEKYAIYVTMTDRRHYDATDNFMHPMRPDDIKEEKVSYQDIQSALSKKEELKLYTIFFQGSTSQIYKLLHQKERVFQGRIRTEKREYNATFLVRQNREYINMIEALYYIFGANYRTWFTVCTAYITKMLDVYLCDAEKIEGKEEVLEIWIDFKEYSELVQYDVIPLWNLKPLTEKTSTYPNPCIDKINYEHQIFSQKLDPKCEYLIRNTDVETTNIRRLNGDLFITCPINQPCEWQMYQVCQCSGKENYPYPVLSNQYKDSFSGSVTEMFRKSIKTKGEMARLIESFDYGAYVTFSGFSICESLPEECIPGNYNMDGFIRDEIRTGGFRQALIIDFSAKDPACYLNEDIMSFLVTQVQRVFPEYHCAGRLI
ncbi:MAG: hypothetical protein HDQ96_16230 [Lachnospiraceae bacterium]|nr:hypothetical protein [Lachnospiraceae bacterium]